MKKHILFLFLLSFSSFFYAQTYKVGTQPEQKKILLEEFTGINCQVCPSGHTLGRNLLEFYKGEAYVIALHCGTFSSPRSDQPDFRVDYANAILALSTGNSFPCGTINRKKFAGKSASVLGKNEWIPSGRTIHKDTAPVNLYIESSINTSTRELTVHVEGYYTKSLNAAPYLNIALIESGIKGPQTGGGVGSDYIHYHMLRDLLTGQWGDIINTYTQGQYFTKSYTYVIPEDYKKVKVNIERLEVVAFMTDTKLGEVINVTGSTPTLPNFETPLFAEIASEPHYMQKKYAAEFFKLVVRNICNDTITNLKFQVTINGNSQTCTWSGVIPPYHQDYIQIQTTTYALKPSNSYKINLTGINDTDFAGNSINGMFGNSIACGSKINFEFRTDKYPEENAIYILNRKGDVIHTFDSLKANTTFEGSVELDSTLNEVYLFQVVDNGGDGVNGSLKIYNEHYSIIYQTSFIDVGGDMIPLRPTILPAKDTTSINKTENADIAVYFDQSTKTYKINLKTKAQISVYNSMGQEVYSTMPTSNEVYLPLFPSGLYVIKINNHQSNITKIIIP